MAKKLSRYQKMDYSMTVAMAAVGVVFLLYLIAAGFGVLWLKVLSALIAILGSALGLGFLYLIGEFKKQRSLWLVVGFGSVIVVTLISILCNYPSPV